MRRRDFITGIAGSAVAWPLVARAQQPQKVPRIGVLLPGTSASFAVRAKAFTDGLRDLGYLEGQTIAIEWRWAEDKIERIPELAAELVRANVDVIVTGGTSAATALECNENNTDRHGDHW
jgi:ABC-type uncharacterized transport system substrate-binding protein